MHSSFIAVFLAVLAPMTVLAWHPHGGPPPPKYDHWHPGGPEVPESSATASVSAASYPAGSSIPAGILPSGNFLPTGVSGALAGPTGGSGSNNRVHLHRGANSTDTLLKVAAPVATATASVTLASYD